jgi:hypothetical protein
VTRRLAGIVFVNLSRRIELVLGCGVTIYQLRDVLSIYYDRKKGFPCRFPATSPIIAARPTQAYDLQQFFPRA